MRMRHYILFFVSITLCVIFSATVFAAANRNTSPANLEQGTALAIANNMRKSGNLNGAINIYRNIVSQPNANIMAYIGLSQTYRKMNQPADAVTVMNAAQKRAPDNEKVLKHLGYALIANKDYRQAVNIFDMLTAINHQSIVGYNGKAVAFDHAGNHVAAHEIYQQALKIQPNSITTQNNLAVSMIMNNKPNEAIRILLPLAKQANATNETYHNLALAYGVKGDKKRARGINLKYMKPEQADQNQQFYDHYKEALKAKHKASRVKERPIKTKKMKKHTSHKKADIDPFEPIISNSVEAPHIPDDDDSFWGNDVKHSYPVK